MAEEPMRPAYEGRGWELAEALHLATLRQCVRNHMAARGVPRRDVARQLGISDYLLQSFLGGSPLREDRHLDALGAWAEHEPDPAVPEEAAAVDLLAWSASTVEKRAAVRRRIAAAVLDAYRDAEACLPDPALIHLLGVVRGER